MMRVGRGVEEVEEEEEEEENDMEGVPSRSGCKGSLSSARFA
jgi:hypothetical protein